jgi:uncharacterized membrane protein YoaK (UPF0700 family)
LEVDLAKVVVLSREEEQAAARKLQDQPYSRLIAAAIVLVVLALLPDCVPFIDEATFIVMSGAVQIAIFRKILKDLGIL